MTAMGSVAKTTHKQTLRGQKDVENQGNKFHDIMINTFDLVPLDFSQLFYSGRKLKCTYV